MLQLYNFIIEYKKGSELVEADTISRIYGNPDISIENSLPKNVLVDSKGIWYHKTEGGEIKTFPKVEESFETLKKSS